MYESDSNEGMYSSSIHEEEFSASREGSETKISSTSKGYLRFARTMSSENNSPEVLDTSVETANSKNYTNYSFDFFESAHVLGHHNNAHDS